MTAGSEDYDETTIRILAVIDRLAPLLAPAGVAWVLETDEVQFLIETTVTPAELATELNEAANRCALLWTSQETPLGAEGNRAIRRWVLALKTAAAMLDRERP